MARFLAKVNSDIKMRSQYAGIAMKPITLITILFASYFLVVTPPSASFAQDEKPLLQKADFKYVGAFRVPDGDYGSSRFGYGGTALAFNPGNHSLFIVGHDHHQQIAEISIPSIVSSSSIEDLAIATVLQPFSDIQSRLPIFGLDGAKIGGLIVIGNELYGTFYEYYDADGNAAYSHFRLSSLNLAAARVDGLFRVGGNINPGFVAGYLAEIPVEWQDDFGMPYLTGQAALSIISRTSAGPAALGFNPSDLGAKAASVVPMVYYPYEHPLAYENTQNPFFNLTTSVDGVLFPGGYRSVVFFGAHGIGPYCYGTGDECGDPVRLSKGTHAYPYIYQAWAYDVKDLIFVKNHSKQPWEVQPYAIWQIDFPFEVGDKRIGGVAYDDQTGTIFISQLNVGYGDEPKPIIHVFKIASLGNNSSEIIIAPNQAGQLPDIVANAKENDTILLEPGKYSISTTLNFAADNVQLRSTTGNRGDVVLDGGYVRQGGPGVGEVIAIRASNITISDISIAHAKWHAIHLAPSNRNIENVLLDNLHIYDCGQQLIKANPAGSASNIYYVDKVTLQNSLIEFVDNNLMEPSGDTYYTGGLDAHATQDWIVRDNVFRGINNNGKLMEHAIHFWRKGRNVTVERNLIINCYRGIGFGLATTPDSNERHYLDQTGDNPYRDQITGVIQNNVIINDPGIFMDSGISLANVVGSKVYYNTIISSANPAPFSCIEYRWSDNVHILNNLTSHKISEREGNSNTEISHNLANVFQNISSLFKDVSDYDVHLFDTAIEVIDKAKYLSEVTTDFDKNERGISPDIGAFELQINLPLIENVSPDVLNSSSRSVKIKGKNF
jgi:hypothetical protein